MDKWSIRKSRYCIVLSLALISLSCSRTDPLSKEAVRKITIGMTEEEVALQIAIPEGTIQREGYPGGVETLLMDGALPRGDLVDAQQVGDGRWEYFSKESGKKVGSLQSWETEERRLVVFFDSSGRVAGKNLFGYQGSELIRVGEMKSGAQAFLAKALLEGRGLQTAKRSLSQLGAEKKVSGPFL